VGILAAFWLLGLYAAAPALRTGANYSFVDRLRDALILGVAIPAVLAGVHLLYPLTCWLALALALVIAIRRPVPERNDAPIPYLLIAALAIVTWPQLIRPLLDGDSLSYHLPNAASWVQSHSLWTTATLYWWYPPASELFASGLYATGGPFALAWAGFGALALLGFRIATWAREEFAASPLLADLLATAAVTVYPLAVQAGTLQNDVWLAAFWLETLWAIGRENGTAMRAIAVTALIKPQGWLFAAIALLATRAPVKVWLAATGAIAALIFRDALLWRGAIVPPASSAYGTPLASSIIAHGMPALASLVTVALRISPLALAALCAALLGPLFGPSYRRIGWAGLASVAVFLVLPFGYASNVAQLATGASLRFAAPAIAAGVLLLMRFARPRPVVAMTLLAASAIYGAGSMLAVFWNDAPTRTAPLVALLAVGAIALGRQKRAPWPAGIGFAAAAFAANWLAASHPVDFYSDALRVDDRSTGLYAWIREHRPPAIGGWGLALGTVNILSPQSRTVALLEPDACATARREALLLVAVAERDRTPESNRARLAAARACGGVVFDDGLAVVALPSSAR
jgi:hypothetical protein